MAVPSHLKTCLAAVGLLVLPAASAVAGFDDDYEAKQWEEVEVQLPGPPVEQSLAAFYVSAASDNRFFIDPASISVGGDGVVRYTLVVVTPGGARNVSFEGMRCETREKRLYAFGRPDGSWSKSRNSQWERVREATTNRHHAALFQEYFCPDGIAVRSADEAKAALRRASTWR